MEPTIVFSPPAHVFSPAEGEYWAEGAADSPYMSKEDFTVSQQDTIVLALGLGSEPLAKLEGGLGLLGMLIFKVVHRIFYNWKLSRVS